MMDPRSEACLAHVHPDLAKVMRGTPQTQPFIIIHGLRTPDEEKANVAKGASQTMHSRHLPNKDGFACAVDIAAMQDGHVSWHEGLYRVIAPRVMAVAVTLSVPVEWGGMWHTLRDFGHFQLTWRAYP